MQGIETSGGKDEIFMTMVPKLDLKISRSPSPKCFTRVILSLPFSGQNITSSFALNLGKGSKIKIKTRLIGIFQLGSGPTQPPSQLEKRKKYTLNHLKEVLNQTLFLMLLAPVWPQERFIK